MTARLCAMKLNASTGDHHLFLLAANSVIRTDICPDPRKFLWRSKDDPCLVVILNTDVDDGAAVLTCRGFWDETIFKLKKHFLSEILRVRIGQKEIIPPWTASSASDSTLTPSPVPSLPPCFTPSSRSSRPAARTFSLPNDLFTPSTSSRTLNIPPLSTSRSVTGKFIGIYRNFDGKPLHRCSTTVSEVLELITLFETVSEVFWELIAPNLMILLLFRSNLKYKLF